MQIDDETTAIQLQKILVENGHPLSLNTILRSRDRLGWSFRGSSYCQMIREQNKEKRLDWARLYLMSRRVMVFKMFCTQMKAALCWNLTSGFAAEKQDNQQNQNLG